MSLVCDRACKSCTAVEVSDEVVSVVVVVVGNGNVVMSLPVSTVLQYVRMYVWEEAIWRLSGWLAGWLVGCLVGWLVIWLDGRQSIITCLVVCGFGLLLVAG